MSAELIESTERAPGLPRAIDSDRCERECDARSETRFPGAPRSPALDRTRGLVEAFVRKRHGAEARGAGSIDGKIPGKFWINLRSTDLHSKYSLPDLAAHEAIPGHVWQGEYTFKLPLVRSLLAFNAYSEGWALYAEQIADELGAYDAGPVGVYLK